MMNIDNANGNKLLIKCQEDEDLNPHPHCLHGPTLLIYQSLYGEANGYYVCAAHRDKRDCNFHQSVIEFNSQNSIKHYGIINITVDAYRKMFEKFVNEDSKNRRYCLTCNVPIFNSDASIHKSHECMNHLTSRELQDPTQFLRPLNNDKGQAQYFFDQKALQFFTRCFQDLSISKVICMGAPRLHAHLRCNAPNIQSFLLDFDHRFFYFLDDTQFAWYNMCNNYFFDKQQKSYFEQFLKCKDTENLLIFTDPPFGCRTEPIAHTLHQITKQHNEINCRPHQPLPIFWIFPYYSEHYIQEQMPELQMCDYKVNYTNHDSYTDIGGKRRKLGSPVRVFSNVPQELLHLPVEEEYKYCAICLRYTALENRHCAICNVCPSKNGCTYRHCHHCGVCVKPSYVHCTECRRCTQVEEHQCYEYQMKQQCWICLQRGHIERNCLAWKKYSSQMDLPLRRRRNNMIITCLLCGHAGHNERQCKQRNKYIEEITFLGEKLLKFKV